MRRASLYYKVVLLEQIAYTKSETTYIKVVTKRGVSTFYKINTYTRTPVKRELKREPEIVFKTETTRRTYIETIELKAGSNLCTYTHVPVPFTLIIPRECSTKRINPIIGSSSFKAAECRYTHFY